MSNIPIVSDEEFEKLKESQTNEANSFSSLTGTAFNQAKQTIYEAADAVGTAIESKTGDTSFTDFLQNFGREGSAEVQQELDRTPSPTLTTSLFDIKNKDDALQFGKYGLATGLGSAPIGIGGLAAMRTLSAPLFGAGPIGIALGTLLSASPIIAMSIGEIFKSAKDKGASEEDAAIGAIKYGLGAGLVDSVFARKVVSTIFDPVKADTIVKDITKDSFTKAAVKNTASLGATGGVTEATQAAISEVGSNQAAGLKTDLKELGKQAVNEGAIGTIFGSAAGLTTSPIAKLQKDAIIQQKKDEDLYSQIQDKIKQEDAENANVIESSTKEIEDLKLKLDKVKKTKRTISPRKLKREGRLEGDLFSLQKTFEEITPTSTEQFNNLNPFEKRKIRELDKKIKKKEEELETIRLEKTTFKGLPKELKKRQDELQSQIDSKKEKLKKAKEKNPFKSELFIMPEPETLLGKGLRKLGEKDVPFLSSPARGLSATIDGLFNRATTPIKRRALELYKKNPNSDEATFLLRTSSDLETFHPAYLQRAGTYNAKLRNALDKIAPVFKTGLKDLSTLIPFAPEAAQKVGVDIKEISGKDSKLIFDGITKGEDFLKSKMGNTKKYESLVSVVRPLKELLDEVGTDAKNAGIDIQLRKNYFPVQYDLSDRKKEAIFREEGLKNGVNKNELENIITNIKEQGGFYFTNFYGEQFRKNKFSERNPNSNLEFTRKLPEPMIDALADKGVVNTNILEVLPSYLMKAAKDIEYEARFKNVDKRAETLLNQNKISDTEYNRIGNTLQAILGKYGTSVPSSLRTPYQFALSAGYILTLPFAALTALAEPLILLSRAKPGSALKSAIQLPVNAFRRTARVFLPRLKKADSEKAFDEMMYGLDGALTERMNASSAIEIPQRLSQQFFKTTMLTQVTQLSRQMAFDSFKSELKNDIKKIRNINPETLEAFDIKRKYRQVGISDIISTVKNLENKPIENIIRQSPMIKQAATRYVDEIIMAPNPVNRPLWMSSPVWAFAAQLKSFMFVFGNTIGMKFIRGVMGKNVRPTERTATLFRMALAMTLIMGVSQFTDLIKEMFKSMDSDDPVRTFNDLARKKKKYGQDSLFESIARTNIFGPTTSIKLALDGYKYGSSPLVSLLLGPFGSSVDKILIGAGEAMGTGKSKRLARAIADSTPILNQNREAKAEFVKILTGEDKNYNDIFEFRNDLNLDEYFGVR